MTEKETAAPGYEAADPDAAKHQSTGLILADQDDDANSRQVTLNPVSPGAAALICVQFGWRVFPIRPDSKTPALKNWPTRATTDLGQVQDWWLGSHAACDVGILTGPESGIWVLDIDVKWTNGFVAVRHLFARHGVTELPDTFRVSTPSGGQQWYFRYPEDGRKVRNSTSEPHRPGRLGPGLEIRGWHGQVVAPNGTTRQVLHDVPVADAPSWLLDLVAFQPEQIKTPAQRFGGVVMRDVALRAVQACADKLAVAGNGGRNSTLNQAAFSLGSLSVVASINEAEVRELLHEACVVNGMLAEEKGELEFAATFKSGWNAGRESGGVQ